MLNEMLRLQCSAEQFFAFAAQYWKLFSKSFALFERGFTLDEHEIMLIEKKEAFGANYGQWI